MQLNHLQFDGVLTSCRGRLLARVALTNEGGLDGFAGGRQHGFGKSADLTAIVGIGGRDMQRQEAAEGIHRRGQGRALP